MVFHPSISIANKLACAKRELEMRKRVYPRWTETGNMTSDKAAHEIAVMQAIVDDYQERLEDEQLF